ncbi:unnamed protein product [Closterium sp. Naga37s-1]|nr:unnamed protein product [Closterium sp. Naga37s-1]
MSTFHSPATCQISSVSAKSDGDGTSVSSVAASPGSSPFCAVGAAPSPPVLARLFLPETGSSSNEISSDSASSSPINSGSETALSDTARSSFAGAIVATGSGRSWRSRQGPVLAGISVLPSGLRPPPPAPLENPRVYPLPVPASCQPHLPLQCPHCCLGPRSRRVLLASRVYIRHVAVPRSQPCSGPSRRWLGSKLLPPLPASGGGTLAVPATPSIVRHLGVPLRVCAHGSSRRSGATQRQPFPTPSVGASFCSPAAAAITAASTAAATGAGDADSAASADCS